MKSNYSYKLLVPGIALLIALACGAPITVTAPTAISSPVTPTATPTPTISEQVTLFPEISTETNQTPVFTIQAQTPQLAGSDDPRVQAFNQQLNDLVKKEVDTFRQSFLQLTGSPITSGSSLEVTYTLISQVSDLWSLKFDFSFYSDGAAHPGLYSITLNYDLGQGRELALGDLFLPNSNYLDAISNYCIGELGKQPFFEGPFAEGANPTLENYRNWNISPEGLMITFDEYQVAPYAAGPQTVIVPYGELKAVIDPHGPLGNLIQ